MGEVVRCRGSELPPTRKMGTLHSGSCGCDCRSVKAWAVILEKKCRERGLTALRPAPPVGGTTRRRKTVRTDPLRVRAKGQAI